MPARWLQAKKLKLKRQQAIRRQNMPRSFGVNPINFSEYINRTRSLKDQPLPTKAAFLRAIEKFLPERVRSVDPRDGAILVDSQVGKERWHPVVCYSSDIETLGFLFSGLEGYFVKIDTMYRKGYCSYTYHTDDIHAILQTENWRRINWKIITKFASSN